MAEQTVELAPGESKVVSFEATPYEAKTYQVAVDGLTGSFVALAPVPVTEILRPNAAGSETSIGYQTPASGQHWDKVDDVTPDDSTTRVQNYQVDSYQRDLYNLPASSIPDGATINFIKIYFRCCRIDAIGYAKPSLRSNGILTDGTGVVPSYWPTWTTYFQQWSTNPANGQAWEVSDLADLQIGVSLKAGGGGGYTFCTQVYVEIDYTPPLPP